MKNIDFDLKYLSYVDFNSLRELPSISALYFVAKQDDSVLYVGQTTNLNNRFKSHHRKYCFKEHFAKRVYYKPLAEEFLLLNEIRYINLLKPKLNGKLREYPKKQQLRVSSLRHFASAGYHLKELKNSLLYSRQEVEVEPGVFVKSWTQVSTYMEVTSNQLNKYIYLHDNLELAEDLGFFDEESGGHRLNFVIRVLRWANDYLKQRPDERNILSISMYFEEQKKLTTDLSLRESLEAKSKLVKELQDYISVLLNNKQREEDPELYDRVEDFNEYLNTFSKTISVS